MPNSRKRVCKRACLRSSASTRAAAGHYGKRESRRERDLEEFFDRLVRQNPSFEHNLEGPDDMPSSYQNGTDTDFGTIPVQNGHSPLGTWQGVYSGSIVRRRIRGR